MSETPNAPKKLIKVYVMDRTGDTRAELGVAEAEKVARDEMGKGKWLRLVSGSGTSEIIRTIGDLNQKIEKTGNRLFEDTSEMALIAALVGGR